MPAVVDPWRICLRKNGRSTGATLEDDELLLFVERNLIGLSDVNIKLHVCAPSAFMT